MYNYLNVVIKFLTCNKQVEWHSAQIHPERAYTSWRHFYQSLRRSSLEGQRLSRGWIHSDVKILLNTSSITNFNTINYYYNIKHRVQNPRRDTNPSQSLSTHVQMSSACLITCVGVVYR